MNFLAAQSQVRRLLTLALGEEYATVIIDTEPSWIEDETDKIHLASLPVVGEPDDPDARTAAVADAARAFAHAVCVRWPEKVVKGFNPATCDVDEAADPV